MTEQDWKPFCDAIPPPLVAKVEHDSALGGWWAEVTDPAVPPEFGRARVFLNDGPPRTVAVQQWLAKRVLHEYARRSHS